MPRLTENYFTLWDRKMGTVDVLNGKDLVLEPDGSFAISVDSRPADGRPNHVRSSPEAFQFYIRDVVLDWSRERINDLSIERLGGPPARPPIGFEEQLDRTAEYMWNWVKDTIRWSSQWGDTPDNEFGFTIDRDTDGALRNQIYILGKFQLSSADEALILNIDLGGADYFVAPISNVWGTTNDILNRTGSLNRAQSVPNPDGTYTYVVSVEDPGVHNWLDPSGLHEGVLTLRWAEFPPEGPGESLSAGSRLVPRSELKGAPAARHPLRLPRGATHAVGRAGAELRLAAPGRLELPRDPPGPPVVLRARQRLGQGLDAPLWVFRARLLRTAANPAQTLYRVRSQGSRRGLKALARRLLRYPAPTECASARDRRGNPP